MYNTNPKFIEMDFTVYPNHHTAVRKSSCISLYVYACICACVFVYGCVCVHVVFKCECGIRTRPLKQQDCMRGTLNSLKHHSFFVWRAYVFIVSGVKCSSKALCNIYIQCLLEIHWIKYMRELRFDQRAHTTTSKRDEQRCVEEMKHA